MKPADGVLAVPKFSRRAGLASLATGGANRAYNENIANRLWAVMMGRGVVHPVDLMHPSNPPSAPEVLKVLTDELVALNFNVKAFLRELALSEAYQHAIELPPELSTLPAQFAVRLAEQKARAELLEATADGHPEKATRLPSRPGTKPKTRWFRWLRSSTKRVSSTRKRARKMRLLKRMSAKSKLSL